MYYLKAPQVARIRLYDIFGEGIFKNVEEEKICQHCGRNKIKPEPLYSTFEQFIFARFADPKMTEELSGADQMELIMRVRAVVRKGPERGVYVFESTDGKRVKAAFTHPTGGYDTRTIHNFEDWIHLGSEMSEKDPRAAAVLAQEPEQTNGAAAEGAPS